MATGALVLRTTRGLLSSWKRGMEKALALGLPKEENSA